MKKILSFIVLFVCVSCTHPVLEKDEYELVEITYTNRNGFNMVLSYDVIIRYDSAYYLGWMSKDSVLTGMRARKFEWKPLK